MGGRNAGEVPARSSKPPRLSFRYICAKDLLSSGGRAHRAAQNQLIMESKSVSSHSNIGPEGRRLTITEFAHKAGIVGDVDMRAVLAARDMAAEGRRAAALDRRHRLELAEAHMAGIGLTPCPATAGENIRHLHPRRR